MKTPQTESMIRLCDFRFYSLIFALGIYALFGAPTPDNPGLAEFIIASALLVSVSGIISRIDNNMKYWPLSAIALFLYIIFISCFAGFMNAWPVTDVIRDGISFAFLFVPFGVVYHFTAIRAAPLGRGGQDENLKRLKMFEWALIFIGLCFSARSILQALSLPFWQVVDAQELHYFANVPTVLFAAIMLLYYAGREVSRLHLLRGACYTALALLPVGAMAMTMQRASLAMLFIALTVLLLGYMAQKPRKAAIVLGIIFCFTIVFWPIMAEIYVMLSHKTVAVGGNMRIEEMAAVFDAVSRDGLSALLGLGLGASYISPAVEGIEVSFTHSLLTSALLKGGFIGLFLVIAYLSVFARMGLGLLKTAPQYALALGAPIIIDVFFYGAYKSLDFGLVLAFVFVSHRVFRTRTHCAEHPCVVSKNNVTQKERSVHQPGLSAP